ncbi:MAG: restriction endonuclease subunit S [Lachnospiraceae bacterium]|nr:restriction endonuclease subunit S [Lachnospiraceae bacterium]
MNKRKVPKLRFKGFSDDWEQRKLGEEAIEIIAGGDVDKEKVVEEGRYPIYANALTNDGIVGYYNEYYRVKAPAVTVTGRGEVGHAQARMVDFTPVVRLLAIRSHHDCYFLENAINNHKVVVESTGVPQLTVPQLSSYDIFFPSSIEEETKIGEYFHSLDNLITLHQRKLDKLKIIKKSMLENCFPKNGEKIPKFRFDGFCGDWEQRKLGELYIERNERGNDSLQILSVSIHTGVSDRALDEETLGKFVKRSEDKSTYKHVYAGDLIFNMMRAWQGAIGVAKNEGMISPAYISAIPNDEVYPLFMDYALRRDSAIAEINNLSYGVTDFRKRLYWDSFVKVGCKIPSVNEQRKIYDYFKNLDNLITLHQRKLEKLKVVKKSMLESMFV